MVRISADTLRYYDEIQLLNPDYINPSNNYRFYTEEQVKDLLYIMDLKECGFNLEEIKSIMKLNDKDKIRKLFEKKKNALFIQRKKVNLAIERIETKLKIMEEKHMKDKILIVDDAGFMRMMVKDILLKNGFEVIEAVDSVDGIIKFGENRPTLTLMDIAMPGIGGIEAVKKIKEIDGEAKIVMLSAGSYPDKVAGSFIAGAVDFIAKPFQADKLVTIANKHLKEDIKLNIDEVKLWQSENYPIGQLRDVTIDELKLKEKLHEALDSCITSSSPADFAAIVPELVNRVKQHIGLVVNTLSQANINELLERFTKE